MKQLDPVPVESHHVSLFETKKSSVAKKRHWHSLSRRTAFVATPPLCIFNRSGHFHQSNHSFIEDLGLNLGEFRLSYALKWRIQT